MNIGYHSRSAAPIGGTPRATRRCQISGINRGGWDLISGVGTTENFVLHSEL
ncbi:hypothetical protein HanXRQr2_Chr05g0195531 [Helianthus annuus]|uniref:Uncharacterized protein n=1 Tax=Helianthus annuus TaxID=4232 RepID=A0A9K3IWK9_HELAN|nr:hypothetical protein HanXRQr2_Chr05g0195531 [Helianthus annuus]KAJ0921226.1 hypothetical protein HanPSC8_Chr05g0189081 [Helianthus annuus]